MFCPCFVLIPPVSLALCPILFSRFTVMYRPIDLNIFKFFSVNNVLQPTCKALLNTNSRVSLELWNRRQRQARKCKVSTTGKRYFIIQEYIAFVLCKMNFWQVNWSFFLLKLFSCSTPSAYRSIIHLQNRLGHNPQPSRHSDTVIFCF